MTEEQLGRAITMSSSLVCAYEDGRRIPEWRALTVLATALSITVDELRPGHATTVEGLRCGAGRDQAAAAAGLRRSGYAMLEHDLPRSLKSGIAAKTAAAWEAKESQVVQAHAAAVRAVGEPAPVLEGTVREGTAAHAGVSAQAPLDLVRSMQSKDCRKQAERRKP